MKYRRLGKTELRVSAIGLGTWQYSGDWGKTFTEEEVCALFARARELGFNLVDTAAGYGDHLAERFLGKALAGQRDQWVIVSKFGREFWLEWKAYAKPIALWTFRAKRWRLFCLL